MSIFTVQVDFPKGAELDKVFPDSHYTPPCAKDSSYKDDGWYTKKLTGKRSICVVNPAELNPIATPRPGSKQSASLKSQHDVDEDGNWFVQSGYTIYYSVNYCKQRCIPKQTSCCTKSTPGFFQDKCCDDGAKKYTYNITYSAKGFVRAPEKTSICPKDQIGLKCPLPACTTTSTVTAEPIDCSYASDVGLCPPCETNVHQCTNYTVFNGPKYGGKKCPPEYNGWKFWDQITYGTCTVWSKQVCTPCKNFTEYTTRFWRMQCASAKVPPRYGYPDPNGKFEEQDMYARIIREGVFGDLEDQGKNILVCA